MKIGPTVDGRIKLFLDDDGDYYLLTQLISDASSGDNIENLVKQLGKNIDEPDWEEFVKPELITHFQKDNITVSNSIKKAYDSEENELFISKDDSQSWYSTINQARLHLEEEWNLSELKEDIDMTSLDQTLVEPFIKNNFYMHLQSLILEYLDWS